MTEIESLRSEVAALRHSVAILFALTHRITADTPDEKDSEALASDLPIYLMQNQNLDLDEDARKALLEIAALARKFDGV